MIKKYALNDEEMIELNVGGTHFTTYRSTLCKYNGKQIIYTPYNIRNHNYNNNNPSTSLIIKNDQLTNLNQLYINIKIRSWGEFFPGNTNWWWIERADSSSIVIQRCLGTYIGESFLWLLRLSSLMESTHSSNLPLASLLWFVNFIFYILYIIDIF